MSIATIQPTDVTPGQAFGGDPHWTKRCQNCGAACDSTASRCHNCWQTFGWSSSPVTGPACPSCGTDLEQTGFCPACLGTYPYGVTGP